MRVLKKLAVLSLVFMLLACKSDDEGNQFLLNIENLSGVHDLSYLTGTIEITVVVNNIPLTATSDIVGDTFQVVAVFNTNGTYTMEGEFRITTTTTGDGNTTTDSEIIVLDEMGTYQLNTNNETITFSGDDDVFSGTFDITLFNETEIRLVQEETMSDNDVTTDSIFELRFMRQ